MPDCKTFVSQPIYRMPGTVSNVLSTMRGLILYSAGPLLRLYQSEDSTQNNLDLLRLLFSYQVVYFHCIVLSGAQAHLPPLLDSVDTAVQGFFLVSGYLVMGSYERSKTLVAYFAKRARRIYPAYFAVVVVAAIGLCFASQAGIAEYFGAAWLKYVAANLAFLNFVTPTLPGVFDQNPVAAVNGSLWTIKVEVAFYLAVPILAALMRPGRRLPLLILLYVSSYLYFLFFKVLAIRTGHSIYEELGKQLPGQLRYFVLGIAMHYYHAQIRKYLGLLGLIAIAVACLVDIDGLWFCKPIVLACIIFAIAFGPFLTNIGRIGDLSYGAYLFHFPIVQLAVSAGFFSTTPRLTVLAIFAIVTVLAYLSWHLLEKPFLAKSSHYRQAEGAEPLDQPSFSSNAR